MSVHSSVRMVRGYELRDPVRIGAAGMVYRAFQPSVQRSVLVRVIPLELIRRLGLASAFEAEAERMARLEHPHILPLYDYWQDETGAYMVARWLPRTLQNTLENGSWPLDAALRLAEQLGMALDTAHRAGIVHHGVAPDLVLLDESGNAYLAGFVLSRMMAGDKANMSALGPFAAPEQRMGKPATPASDLFSLGLLTYRTLTGKAPEWAGAELPPVRTYAPNLPAALDAVLQTATAGQPEHRYADGRRFAAALRASATPAGKVQPLIDPLTERELDILSLMLQGRDNAGIASQLVLSASTVKWYVKQIYSKLDAHTREEAIDRARGLGLAGTQPSNTAAPEVVMTPAAAPAPQRRLPSFSLPFVGRERALADIVALLTGPSHPLITIVAPGGMGKTRLAVEVARTVAPDFPDGVIYVPLAAFHETQFAGALAQSLGLLAAPDKPLWEQVIARCRSGQLLLLLDNFEAVIGAAPLLMELLSAAPQTRLLVTSRERLRLEVETVYVLGSMKAPPEGSGPPQMTESMQLFIERAQRVRFGFAADEASLLTIAEICRMVDGMPLAVVLAASWAEVLPPAEIAAEIRASREFLAAEYADLPERQHSIRAVFESAWERLADEEKLIYARLSVFQGGFTRGTATTVAGATIPTLAALLTKAMIWTEENGRFGLHELLSQFAGEQLASTGEIEAVRETHSRYFLEWGARMEAAICGPDPAAALRMVEADWHNLRGALLWAAGNGHPEWIVPVWKTLWLFHERYARTMTGKALLEETVILLEALPEDAERDCALGVLICVLAAQAHTMWDAPQRDALLERCWPLLERAGRRDLLAFWHFIRGSGLPFESVGDRQTYLDTALNLFRQAGDQWGEASTLITGVWQIMASEREQDFESARRRGYEALALAQGTGDPLLQANVHNVLGLIEGELGGRVECMTQLTQSLAAARLGEDRKRESNTLNNLALEQMNWGQLDQAQKSLEESTAIRREATPFIFIGYEDLGEVFLRKGEFERARPVFAEGESRFQRREQPVWAQIYLLYRVRLAFSLGEWEDLRERVYEMRAIAAETGEAHKLHFALATEAYGAFANENQDEAHAVLTELMRLTEAPSPVIKALASVIEAELTRRKGDAAGAVTAIRAALPELDSGKIEPFTAGWEEAFTPLQARGLLVRALTGCGETEEAQAVALTALERSYAIKAPPFVLAALLTCARTATAGDDERAAETVALIALSPLAFAGDRLMAANLHLELTGRPPTAPARALDWEQEAAEWLAIAE